MMKDDTQDWTSRFEAGIRSNRDGKSPAGADLDALSLPNFRMKFLSWSPDWEDAGDCVAFPLRQMAPQAATYLAKASRYTAREIRTLCRWLKIDPTLDRVAFYEHYLDAVEPEPILAPLLDMLLARNRSQRVGEGPSRSRRGRRTTSIGRYSTPHRLRLSALPDAESRLGNLVLPEVDVILAVGMFFEYALQHFDHTDMTLLDERVCEIMDLGLEEDEETVEEEACDDLDAEKLDMPEKDVRRCAASIVDEDNAERPVGVDFIKRANFLLLALSELLLPDSPAKDFRLIARLAQAAAEIAEAEIAEAEADRELVAMLGALGLAIPDPLPASAAGAIAAFGDRIREAMERQEAIARFEAGVSEADAQVQAASAERRYAALGELGQAAEKIAGLLAEARAAQSAAIQELSALLRSDVDSGTKSDAGSTAAAGAPADTATAGADAKPGVEALAKEAEGGDAVVAGDPATGPVEVEPAKARLEAGINGARLGNAWFGQAGFAQSDEIGDNRTESNEPEGRLVDEESAIEEREAATGGPATGRSVAVDLARHESGDSDGMRRAPAEPMETAGWGVGAAEGATGSETAGGEAPTDVAARPNGKQDMITLVAVRTPILASLIERNLVGIAADAAGAIEVAGQSWPISAAVLRASTAAQAPRDYGPDAQRLAAIVERAMGEIRSDLESVFLLGGLLGAATMHQATLRRRIPELARGRFGQHLIAVAEAVAKLGFDFPPGPDELAALAGVNQVPRRKRLAEKLGAWCDIMAGRRSRWQFASVFMHHVVSPDGPIGAARRAIDVDQPDAIDQARHAIDRFDTPGKIAARAEEFGIAIGRSNDRLYPKGVEYLNGHFTEALGYLADWVRLAEAAGQGARSSEARLRTTIGSLSSRLDKAVQQLEREADAARLDGRALDAAVADWLADRCRDTKAELAGAEAAGFATLEEALTGDRDLLPARLRSIGDENEPDWRPLVVYLADNEALDPTEAMAAARRDGAFDVAARLARRFGHTVDAGAFAEDVARFVAQRTAGIEQQQRRLKALAKVDYANHSDIARRIHWCEMSLARLAAARSAGGSEVDLSDILIQSEELSVVIVAIEARIRVDQEARIRSYATERNAEDAEALLAAMDTLSQQAIEDRIAQLRDGRSAAIFQTDAGRLIADFVPGFVAEASGPVWPRSLDGYRTAFAGDGPLHTEDDRRAAAGELMEAFLALGGAGLERGPRLKGVARLLELLGFDRVVVDQLFRLGSRAWKMRVSASIVSDGWFLPPVFGSKASASGYDLFLLGPDVLPEAIRKETGPNMPSIVMVTGIADFARRREYAERFRAANIPALLVDEALIAFAATRRDTRARTVFECGLPYGRVEPYTTDAGQIPREMFFGREAEIAAIVSRTADGCLVYGGRQLGKSALLSHVAKVFHNPDGDRFVVRRDVKALGKAEPAAAIWQRLAEMLSPEVVKPRSRTPDEVAHDIRGWLARNHGGQIVCLFDETDNFMTAEAKDDYPELSRLKELMEETGRAFKAVFAGLHNVQRTFIQPNSPLAHLGKPICIGPLNRTPDDKRAAHALVVEPMHAAGFRFERPDDVDEILAWANYYPSLIQEFLKGLVSAMHGVGGGQLYRLRGEGPLWMIPSGEIFQHPGYLDVEQRVREKFHLTLDLDPRYALVAYTLAWLSTDGDEEGALVTGYRPEELLRQAMVSWPKTAEQPSRQGFEALLEEMFDLGVLGRLPIPGTRGYRYCLASRQVAAMLGSKDDVLEMLQAIEERDPSVSFDRTVYRRAYAPVAGRDVNLVDGPYAPLTDLQIEQLAGPEGPPVRIICGLGVLGLDKVGIALRRIAEAGRSHLSGAPKERAQVAVVQVGVRELNAVVTAPAPAGILKIVLFAPKDADEAERALSWLDRQHQVLSGAVRPVLLLDGADRSLREMAIRRAPCPEDGIWLRPWGAEMLRIYLDNIEANHLDTKAFRREVLRATGGIPADVIAIVKEARRHGEAEISGWKPARRHVGTLVSGAAGRALVAIDDVGGRDDYETLDALVREEAGVDLVSIAPDLRAMGLVSVWDHRSHIIRRSALGRLIAARIEAEQRVGDGVTSGA